MNCTKAIKKAPKAMDPKWYLKHQYNPLDKEPLPFESDVHEKYQIEHAAEMVN